MSDERLTVLVTGATGFIGSRLVPALLDDGHRVKAMTRHPDDYDGPGDPVGGDVFDPGTLGRADGRASTSPSTWCTPSTTTTSSARTPRPPGRSAWPRPRAAYAQIVYLGGLGKDGERPVAAPAVAPRGREAAGRQRRAGDRAAGRDRGRRRRHLVGDDPPAREEPARDGGAAVGRHPTQPIALDDVIRYLVRRDRRREDLRPGLRDRRRRPAHLRRDAAAGGRGDQRPPGPDRRPSRC